MVSTSRYVVVVVSMISGMEPRGDEREKEKETKRVQ